MATSREPVGRRVLLTGWYSFLHGEATAGDVLAGQAVEAALRGRGLPVDTAWSPVFRPSELHLDRVDPAAYSHVVFACGPVHSRPPDGGAPSPLLELHRRFAACRRIAVGVSVPDPADPAVTGFHVVLPRDAPARPPQPDLALAAPRPLPAVPVVAVVLAPDQAQYGPRRAHDQVGRSLAHWLHRLDAARLPVETRLDAHDWRLCATAAQLRALLARTDVVVTTRMHGLVLALEAGVPVLAVDPVAGGAKVSAQARALGWPAVLTADRLDEDRLGALWGWCRTARARRHAGAIGGRAAATPSALLERLLAELDAAPVR